MLWLYKPGLYGASIVPARPAFKLKSDQRQHEQVHPGTLVCLETAGIRISQALQLQPDDATVLPVLPHYLLPLICKLALGSLASRNASRQSR